MHYCGKSPYGNGPAGGCEILPGKTSRTGVRAVADYKCEWSERKQATECRQNGEPSPTVRSLLMQELQGLGLPAKGGNETHFVVWESVSSGWTVAEADYSHVAGENMTTCQVIAIIDHDSQPHDVRKLQCQQTDADVPTVTTWSLVDVVDVDADGRAEVVLEGDAYEDHWLEVVSVGEDFSFKTIFSGLGYYL